MIHVSVFYPNQEGGRFDHGYYAQKHMGLVKERLGSLGLVRVEVDKGLSGGGSGQPAPFVCIGHLYFNSLADYKTAMKAHGAELLADVPHFTNLSPQFQVSEIIG